MFFHRPITDSVIIDDLDDNDDPIQYKVNYTHDLESDDWEMTSVYRDGVEMNWAEFVKQDYAYNQANNMIEEDCEIMAEFYNTKTNEDE